MRKLLNAKTLYLSLFTVIVLGASVYLGIRYLPKVIAESVSPQDETNGSEKLEIGEFPILSDGQFVYGPNVKGFDLKQYLTEKAPHLLPYYSEIDYYTSAPSVNPRVLLALIEQRSGVITGKESTASPMNINSGSFAQDLATITSKLTDGFYVILRAYYEIPEAQRTPLELTLKDGTSVTLSSKVNAATYALLSAFQQYEDQSQILRLAGTTEGSFYYTYKQLFPESDPLDQSNIILTDNPPSADLLQFPFPIGEDWYFNGVHDWDGQDPASDMSSMDFSTSSSFPNWGSDTSNSWAVAAHPGVVTAVSTGNGMTCGLTIDHGDGWSTYYYHLENVQKGVNDPVKRNEKIGNLANTFAEATCAGGSASGSHVHFTLKYNGALIAINDSYLSSWKVHSGRYNYDNDCNYMYLHRTLRGSFIKKCVVNPADTVNNAASCGGDNPSMNATIYWGDSVKDRSATCEAKYSVTIEDDSQDNSKPFTIQTNPSKKNEYIIKAGDVINLKKGFKAESGSSFKAIIDSTLKN
jgi:LasA protease